MAGTGIKVRNMMKLTTKKLLVTKTELKEAVKALKHSDTGGGGGGVVPGGPPVTPVSAASSPTWRSPTLKAAAAATAAAAAHKETAALNNRMQAREDELALLLQELEDTVTELDTAREETAAAVADKRHSDLLLREVEAVLADRDEEMRAQRKDLAAQLDGLQQQLENSQRTTTERWKLVYHDVLEAGEHLLEAISTGLDVIAEKHDHRCHIRHKTLLNKRSSYPYFSASPPPPHLYPNGIQVQGGRRSGGQPTSAAAGEDGLSAWRVDTEHPRHEGNEGPRGLSS
jgi:DNA repair exonuclease SbcCD ATPase subunit